MYYYYIIIFTSLSLSLSPLCIHGAQEGGLLLAKEKQTGLISTLSMYYYYIIIFISLSLSPLYVYMARKKAVCSCAGQKKLSRALTPYRCI